MRTPRFYPGVWAHAVEAFYGDQAQAHVWMIAPCRELGGIPLDLCRDPLQRTRVLEQIKRMEEFKLKRHPLTAWHKTDVVYPCENGELMFRGTQVLVTSLFGTLRDGGSFHDFLKKHPSVTRYQVDVLFEQIYLDLCDF